MPDQLQSVRTQLPKSEVERIDAEAARRGITRSEFLRQFIIEKQRQPQTKSGNVRFDRQSYARAVEAAAKATPGIPRTQLEWTVSTVINSIAS